MTVSVVSQIKSVSGREHRRAGALSGSFRLFRPSDGFYTPEIGFRFSTSRALALRDTVLLRHGTGDLDSIAQARFQSVTDDQATSFIAVDAALALHDSVTAMRIARQFVDSVMPAITGLTTNVGFVEGFTVLLARRMMLRRTGLAVAWDCAKRREPGTHACSTSGQMRTRNFNSRSAPPRDAAASA